MPHIIVEISRNVADRIVVQHLVDAVHASAVATGSLPVPAIKTRAIVHDDYRVADPASPGDGFVTAVIRIQPGRPDDVVKRIGQAVFDAIAGSIRPIDDIAISTSVDVQFIDKAASFSARLGSARPALAS